MPSYLGRRFSFILSKKVPLRTVLIAPFVMLTVIVVGLTGYLSFLNGRQAVNEVAAQLRTEITAQIGRRLETFLETPNLINQNNANAIRLGLLDANDSAALERYFWEQIKVFDTVTSIYFGNIQGGLVDAGREGAEGFLYVIVTDGFTNGPFRKYATDAQGNRAELLTTVPDFDARTRPWYSGAMETAQATWSDIYILFTEQDMAIAASRPVYGPTGKLLGVVSNDLFLSHISNFLQSLAIGKTGEAFIVEHSGLLVASSTGERLFVAAEGDQPPRRLYAAESNTPLVRESIGQLDEQFGNLEMIESSRQFEFAIDGRRYFAQVTPFHQEQGLDWLIVVVIPEDDFMAQISANTRITILLILGALGLTIVAGILTARWVTEPLLSLNQAAQSLAEEQWTQAITVGRIKEIGELTLSFNTMAGRLTKSLERLTVENAERKQAEQALRHERDLLNLITDTSPAGIIVVSRTGQIAFANRRAEEVLGLAGDRITQRTYNAPAWRITDYDGNLFSDAELPFSRVIATKQPVYDVRHAIQWPDGRRVLLSINAAPLFDDAGQVDGMVATADNITERVRAEEALRESNHRLEAALSELKETQTMLVRQERLAAVGQLAAGIAHDFNNILTSILGYAELLQLSPDISESTRSDLARIINAGQRAAHLVRQLLDFSRKSIRQPQQLDLAAFIKESVKFLEHAIPENIHIHLEISSAIHLVEADPTQLQQLLTNLAVNARDAMSFGGELTVKVSREETKGEEHCVICNQAIEGEWECIEVMDAGSGIPSDIMPHIFEPFFTTKEVGNGTGLGLSQVYGIVTQHGGHITVNSQTGRGTSFAVYLSPITAGPNRLKSDEATAISLGWGETILLVEDEPSVLATTKAMLNHLGYQVVTAINGREALAVYADRKEEIALVLSDMVMPDMEGTVLFNTLKTQNSDVRVVLMSGYPLGERGTELLAQGVIEWFQKPVSLHDLAQIIHQALSNRRAR